MNLTDEQLNIAMCEWIGIDLQGPYWFCDRCEQEVPHQQISYEETHRIEGCGNLVRWVKSNRPNYLSDDSPRRLLNEAEARLTEGQFDTYLQELALVVGYNANEHLDEWPNTGLRKVVSATAHQRTIALLRVVKPEMFQ